MKITLIADIYGQGNNGTSITARRLVDNLRQRGHEVSVISSAPESEIVLPKRKFIAFNHYIEKTNGVSFSAIDEKKLREGIANSDVVHILLPFKVGKKALEICQELHVPFTTAFHCQPENITSHVGMKNWKLPNKMIYKKFLHKFYKNAQFIHCPSKFIASELDKNGYKAQKYVISNGVIPKIHPEKVEKPEIFKDKFVVLCVGRQSKEKRHDLLIKAMKYSKYADKIQLVIGGEGPETKRLEKMGKHLKNKPIIEFLEFDMLKKTLNCADLYVHPSDIEIEAISCIEAFTCGRVPVISNSKRSATTQFALEENNLFKAGDAKALAQRIDWFIEHPNEKEELSKKYIEYGKQFAIEHCIDQMEKMFCDAIAYYKDFYEKHPDKPLRPHMEYPENPEKHIFVTKKNKNHKIVDEKFRYTRKNPFYHIGAGILRIMAWAFLPFWMKPATHYKIRGRENLKKVKKSGVVIISNHVHVTDSPLIASRLFGLKRKVRIVTLSSNMDIPVASSLMVALGAMPVADTLGGMRNFNNKICELLENKKPVLFFPEAALWQYYRGLRPFHKGAFTYATKCNAPILPVLSTFVRRKNGKQKMIVTILPPIYPEGKSAQELMDVCHQTCKDFVDNFYKTHN